MKWLAWLNLDLDRIKFKLKRGKDWVSNFHKSYYFFFFLYVLFYGIHCFWNWDEFMSLNRSIELNALKSGKEVSLWSLYPFQIMAVIFSAGLYFFLCLGINFLFSFGGKARETLRANFVLFLRNLIRQFFLFVCILFLGNQTLGYLVHTRYYAILMVIFWTALFLLFIVQNGKLYKRLFVSENRSVSFISHSLGYVNPILFVFFILVLVSV
ncbi:hypothetical protein EHQ16_01075 [Leptospira kanakyensis]|uniref:DUF4271 domain-containing protein n=1 Tax=Leptospira kanakyensis TaxID=2484968 RepID=A0A6N4Q7N1_9LEPT|nr:hypothetical protein [Leptospira kanakyensis]TGK47901.1 hypothetical protein EHQ11_18510 [Leptospira kanakyensis]TGK63091.1 hypothetical protein EHQ16_01075 [Leptospira kanakyensis]TGK66697.1 hypothetical protein EHQ18_16310 [Leptospira kanakyensis]